MANNVKVNNKIGCSAGRTSIVDPNNFDGFQSSSNMPVSQEDLTISVILKTFKRGRTVLDEETDTFQTSSTVQVNFIEGTDVTGSGKKSLTTSFTELTTVFEKGTLNNETLGITSIDIDFNSSYAPMITINFVDVRGSSIYQNEEKILVPNTNNKFATFFQLPYPIFELEIKGYYGKPVTYCLHMLKFNSKFNSKNGNFEIQCQFVGYTYAMFSDMLIGYLKAIPYSDMGAAKYEEIRKARGPRGSEVIDLVELMKKISDINKGVKRIASTSDNSKQINNVEAGTSALNTIKNLINGLGSSFIFDNASKKTTDFSYIFRKSGAVELTEQNAIDSYLEGVRTQISEFNGFNLGATLDEKLFTDLTTIGVGRGYYTNYKKPMLDPNEKNANDITLSQRLGSDANLQNLKTNIFKYISGNYTFENELEFDFYDMNNLFLEISKAQAIIDKRLKTAKEALALELKDNVRTTLGFEPTVRKIIEIFTISIEVFMECVFDVSVAAERTDNALRTTELERKFKPDELQKSDIAKNFLDAKRFFSWPDYREKDEDTKAYVEKYLGTKGVLDIPTNVDEIRFIDDLLRGFIKARQAENAITNEENEFTWYPVNAFDTKLFIPTDEPYSRAELLNPNDSALIAVIRAMIYLGYTNNPSFITQAEIDNMANVEADALMRGIKNDNVKSALIASSLNTFINSAGEINLSQRKVLDVVGTDYVYQYILSQYTPHKILPLSTMFFKSEWPSTDGELAALGASANIFLTNYGSAAFENGTQLVKADDGGQYIQILSSNEYTDGKTNLFPAGVTLKPSATLDFEKIKEAKLDTNSGFESITNDNYGIQDFAKINFDALKDAPMKYVFYSDVTSVANFLYKEKPSSYVFKPDDWVRVIGMYTNVLDAYSGYGQNRTALNSVGTLGTVSYPFIQYRINYNDVNFDNVSLFGSPWFYYQKDAVCKFGNKTQNCERYSKGLIFLSTLPFNMKGDPFGRPEILNLFNKKGGFVHAPRLWCAFVGGLLWWKDKSAPEIENNRIIGGGSGTGDPIIWKRFNGTVTDFFLPPKTDRYFPVELEIFRGNFRDDNDDYPVIGASDKINTLPQQVKNEFKRIFFEFINGKTSSNLKGTDGLISYDEVVGKLEIWGGTGNELCTLINQMDDNLPELPKRDGRFYDGRVVANSNNIKNREFYDVITIWPFGGEQHNELVVGLKGDISSNEAMRNLINAMNEEVVIANAGYKIWDNPDPSTFVKYETVKVDKTVLSGYLTSLITRIKSNDVYNPETVNNNIEQQVFGTSNEDVIKLQLYRTCKNIKDKWLGGLRDKEEMIFQCGRFKRNGVDRELSKKYGSDKLRLIDSFRFISRAFSDIGDKLYINPTPINDYLHDNPNTSAYDAISSILASNNFEFIALPTFVNFKDPKELEAIFTPFEYNVDKVAASACGPSFVCVYIGQKSKHLDLNDTNYPTDGFDLRCANGNMDKSVPTDLTANSEPHEDPIGAFVVKFSQQNQNIFKDISLDQSEFSETDESIQIQDDISRKGTETNRSIVGQNLYNVYSVRSYTAQVEMMGNAMIQPMMYFQLDNIPMFHGAYMITRVKHSIVPNHMSTNFTGVRIKQTQTKLVDAMDVYMSLLETLDTSGAGTGAAAGGTLNLAPIVVTIVDNGGVNGNISGDTGFITTTQIPHIDGFDNGKSKSPDENVLLTEAVAPFVEMVKAWIAFMKTDGFSGSTGNRKIYAGLTSAFRSIQKQIDLQKGPNPAADVGRSSHGWGIAVDFQFYDRKGNQIPNKQNPANFDEASNPALIWLLNNSWKYGWVIPYPMRDRAGTSDEFWHFEYHGTAAQCLMEKNLTTYGHTTVIPKGSVQKPSVINPRTKDGLRAVYVGCDYKDVVVDGSETILGGDADYWTLLAVCSMEATSPQGRADVAQVIYNRFSHPKKAYGSSIKEVIIAKGQFEPTFKNEAEWAAISDKASAVKAVMNSKGTSEKATLQALIDTDKALKDKKLTASSRNLIGSRPDFRGFKVKPAPKPTRVDLVNRNSGTESLQYFFYEEGNGFGLRDKPPGGPLSQFA